VRLSSRVTPPLQASAFEYPSLHCPVLRGESHSSNSGPLRSNGPNTAEPTQWYHRAAQGKRKATCTCVKRGGIGAGNFSSRVASKPKLRLPVPQAL